MLTKILKKLTTTITGASIIIAAFSILSRLLGLVRDRLLASQFGAGDTLDVYYAAFKLPDLIFNTLVLGALSAAFIPVFIKLLSKDNDGFNHWQLSSAIINTLSIALFILAVIIFVLANQLIPLITPGFSDEQLSLTISLTRIMLISIIFFGVSNVLSGILQSLKKFVAFSLAPVVYNLGIIFGILFLVPRYGPFGLAWGVVLGSLLHLLVQIPSTFKVGFRWQPILSLHQQSVRQVGKLLLPRTFALAVNQINQLIVTIIGSTLTVGSIAIFNLAYNLESFPIGVFAISIAIASFPVFSEAFAEDNQKKFVVQFSVSIRRILYLIIPTSIFIILLRAQFVRLVLGSGRFDWTDTILTSNALGYFSLSLFAQSIIPLLARAFYATHDTKTPVIISLISVGINILGSLIIAPIMGVTGLALSFSISNIINLILLATTLKHKLGWMDEKKIFYSTFKITIAAIFGAVALQISKGIIAPFVNMQTYLGILIQFIGAGCAGAGTFFVISLLLKCEEIDVIKRIKLNKNL